jgi:hypothetical protein
MSLISKKKITVQNLNKIAPFGITVVPVFFLVMSIAVLFIALAGLPLKPPTYRGQTNLFNNNKTSIDLFPIKAFFVPRIEEDRLKALKYEKR